MPLHLPVMTHQLARRIQQLLEDEQLEQPCLLSASEDVTPL